MKKETAGNEYAPVKTTVEQMSKIPFNWREGLPARGWRILSEEPAPGGRRALAVNVETGLLMFQRHSRHGSGRGPAPKVGGQKALSPDKMAEALAFVNRLWATTPPFREAHRTNVINLVTLILSDGDVFKAYSSPEPTDELHQFNVKLWQWTVDK